MPRRPAPRYVRPSDTSYRNTRDLDPDQFYRGFYPTPMDHSGPSIVGPRRRPVSPPRPSIPDDPNIWNVREEQQVSNSQYYDIEAASPMPRHPEYESSSASDTLDLDDARDPTGALRKVQNDLAEEQQRCAHAEAELRKKASQLQETRKMWKEAVSQLSKAASEDKTFHQLTDTDLVEMVSRLRYNIRNFAVVHFEGERHLEPQDSGYWSLYKALWQKCMQPTGSTSWLQWQYLSSSTKRPAIIQAILWRFLDQFMFNQFVWAGPVAQSMCDMYDKLIPAHEPSVNPEAYRKFHTWLATTAGYLTDAPVREGEDRRAVDCYKARLAGKIVHNLMPYMGHCDLEHLENYCKEVHQILDLATCIDREGYKQVARVEWKFPRRQTAIRYDARRMQVQEGERQEANSLDEDYVVIAPALTKRGKSNGEDFENEDLLLPMEVSYLP